MFNTKQVTADGLQNTKLEAAGSGVVLTVDKLVNDKVIGTEVIKGEPYHRPK